ncbi:MAG: flagellar hook-associated protein FlgL [Gammaproteobacteria bacterium]|jgi:flagellar hook-associated protein 3 FlgL|nr:flagellar hook-associated protein FlgL [Gammaproteobacteria bacterium]MBT3488984.1 flagellar hook-associated protein FlgL [Gammaproteobacteria bacterium]MBT3717448.1 flagellar hook-associated protein FlgL [Gammaproteobacteria bacterium]MBT3844616.1 flagellar hook-associated protein FlgL [Gammaproteobacteria bacterium]MBT3892775.1 flagellar hook-associated protein FlgL [Gammaproteobacteria bacterium]
MRISTISMQQQGVDAILDKQVSISETEMQLATGRKILRPSDDPVNSSMVLKLKESVSLSEQYLRNGELATAALSFEESTLEGITNNIQRARELALQGMNGTNSAESREAIALEVQQIREAIFNLGNTRDEQGEYIFAGTKAPTAPGPFKSTDPKLASVVFDGNESQRVIQIGMDQRVTAKDSALDIFGKQETEVLGSAVTNSSQVLEGAAVAIGDVTGMTINGIAIDDVVGGTDAATIATDVVANINAKTGETGVSAVVAADGGIRLTSGESLTAGGSNNGDIVVAVATGGDIAASGIEAGNYRKTSGLMINGTLIGDVSAGADPAASADNMVNQINIYTAQTGVTAVAGANNKIELTSNDDIVISTADGGDISATGLKNGTSRNDDIFTALGSLVEWLNPADPDNPQIETSDGLLESLDKGLDRVLTIESKIGARINMIERHSDVERSFVDKIRENISDINDVDYAEAIAQFNLDRVGIQAAQQAYSKIQGLSLFDYLR